jgi:hypothetical protein
MTEDVDPLDLWEPPPFEPTRREGKLYARLATWRRDENVPITHWWWYLDVLAQLPELPTNEMIPEQTVA